MAGIERDNFGDIAGAIDVDLWRLKPGVQGSDKLLEPVVRFFDYVLRGIAYDHGQNAPGVQIPSEVTEAYQFLATAMPDWVRPDDTFFNRILNVRNALAGLMTPDELRRLGYDPREIEITDRGTTSAKELLLKLRKIYGENK